VEDYCANRKGPQQGGATVGFGFGSGAVPQTQAATGFGTFGQPNKPTTGTFGGKTIVTDRARYNLFVLILPLKTNKPNQTTPIVTNTSFCFVY